MAVSSAEASFRCPLQRHGSLGSLKMTWCFQLRYAYFFQIEQDGVVAETEEGHGDHEPAECLENLGVPRFLTSSIVPSRGENDQDVVGQILMRKWR